MFQKAWLQGALVSSPGLDTQWQGLPHSAVHQGLDVGALLSHPLHQHLYFWKVI